MKCKFMNTRINLGTQKKYKDGRQRLIYVTSGDKLVCSKNDYGSKKNIDNKNF